MLQFILMEEQEADIPEAPNHISSKIRKYEAMVTVYQVIHVFASIAMEILEIRLSLHRLNPPRLLIPQTLAYLGMFAIGYLHRTFTCCRKSTGKSPEERLGAITASILTLLDISCDASSKIAFALSEHHIIESYFGFLAVFQTIISYIAFRQSINFIQFIALCIQTAGYIIVSSNVVGQKAEPYTIPFRVLTLESHDAGVVFATMSLIFRCLNLTMTQALSTSIHMTPASFCIDTGIYGLLITSLYHGVIYKLHKDKFVILTTFKEIYTSCGLFILFASAKAYTGFWLVLKTKAVEYTRVYLLSMLFMFFFRHSMFREEGAPYGFAKIPLNGIIITSIGFALLTLTPLGQSDHEYTSI